MVKFNTLLRGYGKARRAAGTSGFPLLAALLLASLSALGAETAVSTELTFMTSLERTSSGGTGFYQIADGKFSLTSADSPGVKGQLTVDVKVADTVLLDVTKAWVKAQLAAVRFTAGKTRLSWGDGYMYNAGDVIFGGKNADLSAEELRDNNTALVALYLPFGDFSFIETAVFPPDLPVLAYQQYAQLKAANPANPFLKEPELAGPDKSSLGGRIYTKIGGVKAEAGYLYDGSTAAHKPYVSAQGHALADLHLSSSIALPVSGPLKAETAESWQITGGFLYQLPLSSNGENPSSGSLDFRLEASVMPYGSWEARVLTPEPVNPLSGTGTAPAYALSVFPQISWKSDTVFAYVRSIWSPIDLSAVAGAGLHWGPLQGFKILSGFNVQTGEKGDAYYSGGSCGWQLLLGTRFTF
jgi:hypothetical protein